MGKHQGLYGTFVGIIRCGKSRLAVWVSTQLGNQFAGLSARFGIRLQVGI